MAASSTGKLAGKVAVVSGSGRGIGREIALKLAADGASVVVNDLDAEPATRPSPTSRLPAAAVACVGRVTDDGFAERFVQTAVDAFGGLDIIVNNAGYTWDAVIQKMTDEQWDAILDVHLKAPFRILRAAQPVSPPRSRPSGPATVPCRKVVNISSIAGLRWQRRAGELRGGQGRRHGLTKALAKEWGRYNVTVNTVAFGLIRTRLTEAPADDDATIDIDGREITSRRQPGPPRADGAA